MSDAEPTIRLEYYTGVKRYEPPVYTVREETEGRWWWRRDVFWLDTEFSRLGPLSLDELRQAIVTIVGCGSRVDLPPKLASEWGVASLGARQR